MPQDVNILFEALKAKGTKRNIEKYYDEQIKHIDKLKGDAKLVLQAAYNIHPEFTKYNVYEFYDKMPRYEYVKNILLDDNIWDKDEFMEIWMEFFPKHWQEEIVPVWKYMTIYARVQLFNFLGTNWYYDEIGLLEMIDYYGFHFHESFYFEQCFVKKLNDNDKVYVDKAKAILNNESEVGSINELLIRTILQSNQQPLWEDLKNLLLTAQRQEGLRNAIINNIHSGHGASRFLFIKTIIENELLRFTSVNKKIEDYFYLPLAEGKASTEKEHYHFGKIILNIYEKGGLNAEVILKNKNLTAAYFQLWVLRESNPQLFWQVAEEIMASDDEVKQAMVLHTTTPLGHKGFIFAKKYVRDVKDLSVKWNIWKSFNRMPGDEPYDAQDGVFEFFEQLIKDIPQEELKNPTPKFTWDDYHFKIQFLSIHWIYRVGRATKRCIDILPYEDRLPNQEKGGLLQWHFEKEYYEIVNQTNKNFVFQPNDFERKWIVKNIQDKAPYVYNTAFTFYNALTPLPEELPVLCDLLRKKSEDIRSKILAILHKLPETQMQEVIHILLNEKTDEQLMAGMDLLQQLKNNKKLPDFVNEKINELKSRKKISSKAELILQDLSEVKIIKKQDVGYGLYEPLNRGKIVLEKPSNGFFIEKMYKKPLLGMSVSEDHLCKELKKLDALVTEHENYEYTSEQYDKSKNTVLLGPNYLQRLSYYNTNNPEFVEDINNFPLAEVWTKWYNESGLTELDLYIFLNFRDNFDLKGNKLLPKWYVEILSSYLLPLNNDIFDAPNVLKLKYPSHVSNILYAFRKDKKIRNQIIDIELDVTMHFFSSIPKDKLTEKFHSIEGSPLYTWREYGLLVYNNLEQWEQHYYPSIMPRIEDLSDEQFIKYWRIRFWFIGDLIANNAQSMYQSIMPYTIGRAHQLGLIDDNEVHFLTLETPVWQYLVNYPPLEILNIRKQFPVYEKFIEKAVPHLLELELLRGESPTATSKFACFISEIKGLNYFVKILKGLGKDTLQRGYTYGNDTKGTLFSRFLKASKPLPSETFEDFKAAIEPLKLSDKRLLEIALYAPQWLPWMEQYLGWNGLQSAAWCLHAHAHSYFDMQKESELAKYTSISTEDFKDGGVDVQWYKLAYETLGEKRFQEVHEAAHIICDNSGYIRARVYADTVLGKISLDECKAKVNDKRNKDYVVGIGLIPLDIKNKEADILDRYKFLQSFKVQSKEFGQQRQASEKRVVDMAMDNLARNAGYPDPIRLTWAMETLEVKSLMANAENLNIEDTSISLQITTEGKAEVQAIKKDKVLASIPAALKKNEDVLELIEIKNNLNAQHSRIKKSLEEAMIRGDVFEAKEMKMLQEHPIMQSLFNSLLWIGDNGEINFYKNIAKHKSFRIAHCVDLFESGKWSQFQHQIFKEQIVQPFKQVFRELYTPTKDELDAQGISMRYNGYQVNATQAGALFRNRAWSANYYEGMHKVYHKEKIKVSVDVYADWFNPQNASPADIHGVRFYHKLSGEVMAIKDVPKALFSEVMRDLDLVVSVAHIGGVDIEASLSSMELRAAIVQETTLLFDLKNVTIEKSHIFIKGSRGEYTIHLGSGIVHMKPSKMLHIAPVSTQARGRIFLPFVDEDPKTAEIVSKVLLLAKDKEIKDPGLLGQM